MTSALYNLPPRNVIKCYLKKRKPKNMAGNVEKMQFIGVLKKKNRKKKWKKRRFDSVGVKLTLVGSPAFIKMATP